MPTSRAALSVTAAATLLALTLGGCTSSGGTDPRPSQTTTTGTGDPAPTTTGSGDPSPSAKAGTPWEKTLRRLGRRTGVHHLNSPEPQFQSARMTGDWNGHGVLLVLYADLAHKTPGRTLETFRVSSQRAALIEPPLGPQVIRIICTPDLYLEASVVEQPTYTTHAALLRPATITLLRHLIDEAHCAHS